jgi:hypothetical protein
VRLFLLVFVYQCYANSSDYDAARSNALAAAYRQSGFESAVTNYAKNMDEKYIPSYINDNGIIAMILFQCVEKHELSWTWRF